MFNEKIIFHEGIPVDKGYYPLAGCPFAHSLLLLNSLLASAKKNLLPLLLEFPDFLAYRHFKQLFTI